MKKKKAKVESTMDVAKAVEYLDDIVRSLRSGTVRILNGESSLSLSPTGAVRAEIKASQKLDKESISVKLSWRKDTSVETEPALRIGGSTPKAVGKSVDCR